MSKLTRANPASRKTTVALFFPRGTCANDLAEQTRRLLGTERVEKVKKTLRLNDCDRFRVAVRRLPAGLG